MFFTLQPSVSLSNLGYFGKIVTSQLYLFILDTGAGIDRKRLRDLIGMYLELHHVTGKRIKILAPEIRLPHHPNVARDFKNQGDVARDRYQALKRAGVDDETAQNVSGYQGDPSIFANPYRLR